MSDRSQIIDHTLLPEGRIAALFPAKDDLDGIERIALSFWAWASQSCRCSGWH